MLRIFLRLLPLFLFAFVFAGFARAQTREDRTVSVRTGEHAAYDRIVFDAPYGARHELTRDGNLVVVYISPFAKLKMSGWKLRRARDLELVPARQGKDELAVRFKTDPSARIENFKNGDSIVIDVWAARTTLITPPPQKTPPPSSETSAETERKREAEKKVSPQGEAPQGEAPAVSSAPPAAENVLRLPEETVKKQKRAEREAFAPAPRAAPLPPVEIKTPLPDIPLAAKPRNPSLSEQEAQRLLTLAVEVNPAPVAVFDPEIVVGAAVFTRGGAATILFDRKFSTPVLQTNPSPRVEILPFDLARNTGYRIEVPEGVEARASREGTAWQIFLAEKEAFAGVSTDFVIQPDFALGARLLLPTAEPPTPILFEDPVVGDTLIAVPLKGSEAFTIPRRLVEFEVVPAAQGLVIKPWHEKIIARVVPDGIEITAEGGLKLSPVRDTGLFGENEQSKRLFDFNRWRGREGETFVQTRQKLMRTIVDVPEKDKPLARMDLARLYFANGMGREALALLNIIHETLPEIEFQPDFLALRGACRIMAGELEDGMKDLGNEAVADLMEGMLWRAVGAAKMRDWTTAADLFSKSIKMLDHYNEPFRSQFRILSVESALAAARDTEAAAWLTELENGPRRENVGSALAYLRGVLAAKEGHIDAAGKFWRQAAKGSDRLYKIRAELALVDLGVATKSLTPKQAVERLEGLRYAWRGDDLEFEILRRLGVFYINDASFKKGLNVLSSAVRLFPKGPQTMALKTEMVEIFKNIIMTEQGASLSPIDALSLYTEFTYLIPSGEEGNGIRLNLSERLVAIDLLDQAAALLGEVVENTPLLPEKAKIATRLAGVRLLDHRAKEALDVLDRSEPDAQTASEQTRIERQLLRARALSENGEHEKALAALPDEAGSSAKLLRADIAMRARQWDEAIETLLDLVGPAPSSPQALSSDQASWLVNAALAMAQKGDLEALDGLARNYGAAMDQTTQSDMFRVLTRPEKTTQFKDLAAAHARLSEVDMFQGFLSAYRKGETPPPPP